MKLFDKYDSLSAMRTLARNLPPGRRDTSEHRRDIRSEGRGLGAPSGHPCYVSSRTTSIEAEPTALKTAGAQETADPGRRSSVESSSLWN